MNKEMILSDKLKLVFSSEGPHSHWFGYYNYSPISADGTKLLVHKVDFDGRNIKPDDTAEIGYYTLADGVWHPLATTRAINWQQGAMLQWLGPDFNSRAIFNDAEGGHFVSRIYDVGSGCLVRTIPFAVYGVTPDGKTSISLQFERSYWCRAYHYESIANPVWKGGAPESDGIFRVNLETGEVKRILSIGEIIQHAEWKARDDESQWVEHIMLNPSGTRFAFYYRCGAKGEFSKTVGLVASVDGDDVKIMPLDATADPSHLGWRDDSNFVVYCYVKNATIRNYTAVVKSQKLGAKIVKNLVRKIVKRFLPSKVVNAVKGCSYYAMVDIDTGTMSKLPIIHLPEDGHPSFTKDGRYMLTDTYADKDSYRHLVLYDVLHGKVVELGKFFSPFNCCGYRSDLHPRFSRDEKRVIIDSAHTGQHQIHVFDLDWGNI